MKISEQNLAQRKTSDSNNWEGDRKRGGGVDLKEPGNFWEKEG